MKLISVSLLLLCLGASWSAALLARTGPAIDPASLQLRWQDYAATALQAKPSMVFPYAACFQRAATAHALPETLLLAVARGESNFEPAARSRANAIGLMQILWPVTAQHLDLVQLSEVLDPCTNIDAGARYLKELLARYDGDLHRSLAAYNYGPARIPVSGGPLPEGAVWYSAYILRHLDFVLHGGGAPDLETPPPYAGGDRLFVIHFSRPYRAAAFVKNLQSDFGDLRLDWFRATAGGFDVVMLFASADERTRGQALLERLGFG